jgi:hypothetical protein
MQPETAIQPQPAPAARALTCPGCGGGVELRAAGYTVHVACQYCGSILDVTDPQVKLVTRYNESVAELEIPLGTRGIAARRRMGSDRLSASLREWRLWLGRVSALQSLSRLSLAGETRGGWSLGEMLTVTPEWLLRPARRRRGILHALLRRWRARRSITCSANSTGASRWASAWRPPTGSSPAQCSRAKRTEARSAGPAMRGCRSRKSKKPSASSQQIPWPPLPHQPSPYTGNGSRQVSCSARPHSPSCSSSRSCSGAANGRRRAPSRSTPTAASRA